MTHRPPRRSRTVSPLTRIVTPLLRTGMRALSAAAPPVAGRAAFEMFLRPPRIPSHPSAHETMARGRRFTIPLDVDAVTAWTWGAGPAVLLTHGWGGRASQLAGFVDPLLRQGMRVIAYDAPAHGTSPGRQTNVRHAAEAARAVADTVGGLHGVVAHSLGVTAVLLAFEHGLSVHRAAFMAPPDDLGYFFQDFAGRLGLNEPALRHLELRIERITGVPWRQFRAERLGAQQHVPLLIVHDEDDEDVPISHGRAWQRAWPGAQLINTAGLGHRAPLRSPMVIDHVTRFVSQNVPAAITAERGGP